MYGVGMLATRLVSFIMLPVYTHRLSTADYGLLSLLQVMIDVVAIFSTAGAASGVMRYYFKNRDEVARRRLVTTAHVMLAGLGLFGALLLAFNAGWVWRRFLDGAGSTTLLYIAALTFAIDSLSTVPMALLQAEGKATAYASVLVGKLVMQLSLNILFLLVLERGVGGVLVSSLIASTVTGLVLNIWFLRRGGFAWSGAAARDLRRYGLPYQFVTAGTFVLAFGDRFFLQAHAGRAEVGLYSLAYQFGFLLTGSAAAPFMRAWLPVRFSLLQLPAAQREAEDNRGFLYLSLVCITVATGLSVFVRPTLQVMTSPAYFEASRYVPVILLAYLFQVWNDVVSFGSQAAERTKWITVSTWISVVAVLVLYTALIPLYGAMGAAVATLGSFVVRFACQYYFSQRIFPMHYHWGAPLKMLAAGTIVAATSHLIITHSLYVDIAMGFGLFAGYSLYVWFLVLRPRERLEVETFIARQLRRIGVLPRADAIADDTIQVTHVHAARDNLGDELLTRVLRQQLSERLAPRTATFTSVSSDPADDVRIGSRPSAGTLGRLAGTIARSDVVVLGGGEVIGPFPAYVAAAVAARLMGRQVLWLGAAGRHDGGGRAHRWFLRYALRGASGIYVRDLATFDDLRPVVAPDRLMRGADLAFSWRAEAPPRAARTRSIGVALRSPERRERPWSEKDYLAIAQVLADFRDKGYEIVLFSFLTREAASRVGSPSADQRYASDDDVNDVLLRHLGRDGVQVVATGRDASLVASRIASLDILVGMRLHSLIIAALTGTPFVPLDYAPKIEQLAESLDASGLLIRPGEVESRLAGILATELEPAAWDARHDLLGRRVDALRGEADRLFDASARHIIRSPAPAGIWARGRARAAMLFYALYLRA